MITRKRVVVTGLGLATPLGLEVEENWQKLLCGISGIDRLALPQTESSPIQAAGQVKESDYYRIKEAFQEDATNEGERRTLFGLWAAKSALRDADLLDFVGNRDRYGVVAAAGLGIIKLEDIHRWLTQGGKFDYLKFSKEYNHIHEESMLRNNADRASALISKRFRCKGANLTITSACASATQALGLGYRCVRRGDAEVMVSGGADSMIHPVGLMAFVLLAAASVSRGDPRTVCRPFDRKRSGLVIGEGAGFVVLEELSHAENRGAKIYAEVVGYGSSMDAFEVTAPHPQGRGAEQSMRMALQDAGLSKGEIDYINAHGTSTKLNDVTETMAIKKVFGEHAHRICISSSKSMIGHLMAAAGAPEFIYTVLTVQNDEIHPTINLDHPDPKCDLDYVPRVKRTRTVRAALSNSFGFGGQNASIVVRKFLH